MNKRAKHAVPQEMIDETNEKLFYTKFIFFFYYLINIRSFKLIRFVSDK